MSLGREKETKKIVRSLQYHTLLVVAVWLYYLVRINVYDILGVEGELVSIVVDILLMPWGLLFIPIRYSYTMGMLDILQGDKTDITRYIRVLPKMSGVIVIEYVVIIITYLLMGINYRWGTSVFTLMMLYLHYFTRAAMVYKAGELGRGITEVVDGAIEVIIKGIKIVTLLVLSRVVIGLVQKEYLEGFQDILNVGVYITNIVIIKKYIKIKEEKKEGLDE